MACRTTRKGPRRPAAKAPPVDQELVELASVIAEYSLDNNAFGWFQVPWRDGWNAVGLACTLSQIEPPSWLYKAIDTRNIEPSMYWLAEEQLADCTDPMLRAALRCLQVLIANSSGGGHAYNAILIPPFTGLDPERITDTIMEWRCRDSIGTTVQFQGDANDRQRGAFRAAWRRGLYLAAYSLPPATVRGQMKVYK